MSVFVQSDLIRRDFVVVTQSLDELEDFSKLNLK